MSMVCALPVFGIVCTSCQSYKSGMEKICNAPNLANITPKDDATMQQVKMAKYIEDNVTNDKAHSLFYSLGYADPKYKIFFLRQAAKEADISSCPFADWLATPHPD
jgi:hypothetical protein